MNYLLSFFVALIFSVHGLQVQGDDANFAVLANKQEIGGNTKFNVADENKIEENIVSNVDDLLFREQYANRMISYMNQSVDPCDDFYEYACGNWKNTLSKRNTHKRRVNLLEINFELFDKVKGLLEHPNEELEQKYENELKQARIFYRSCLAADLEKLPNSDVYLEILQSIGGFPAVNESWNSKSFDWFNVSAQLSLYGVNSLTNEFIVPQFPFPPYFELIELGFDEIMRNDSIGDTASSAYKSNEKRMREYLSTYGVVEPKITKVINSIFELWQAILNVSSEFSDKYDCRELGKVKNLTEWKKFEVYFELAWNGLKHEHAISNCPCAYFYAKLDEICNERKEAVANYLALKFLFHMDARLHEKAFQEDFCNMKVKSSLQFLIDQLYMAEYFQHDNDHEIVLMTKGIRSSLRENFKSLDWLDEDTRNEALFKESTIDLRIGRYEDNKFMDNLIQEIRSLNFNETNYEKNNVEIVKFEQFMKRYNGLHYKGLEENTKPLEMLIGMQAQGFYFNPDNSINIMAALLQPPAYHKFWPLSLKYGTLGFLIGHELTHAFDTVGAGFDGSGEERNWWTKKANELFENRTKCYVEMFNEYEVPEIHKHIDGNFTVDENIADHGGLRHAFNAYKSHIKRMDIDKDSKMERMPGLDHTSEQLFYLGFAQIWCADFKENNYWEELRDAHTIDKYRVLGALSNTEEFAEAYNCPVGSAMNPARKKCRLW